MRQKSLARRIAFRMAQAYAAKTFGDYPARELWRRGGDWTTMLVEEMLEPLTKALGQYPARCDCSSDEQHYGRIVVWYCTKLAPLLEAAKGGKYG